jgi:hypothetical protein
MQTFRYSRSLLNLHGFLGGATAHAAAGMIRIRHGLVLAGEYAQG